jgi:enoyl-CoA hydratase/carnithine racemase
MVDTRANEEELLYTLRDGIAHVVFNRAHARNALTFAIYDRLRQICQTVSASPTVRAMIITGSGDRAFAAGTDISEFLSFHRMQDAIAYEERMEQVLSTLESCRVPTIAAISGACTGGGAAIASCCDLRIGTRAVKIGIPIARTLGNCLSMANLGRLSALIGPARVKEMIFTGRLIEGPEALSIGLLNEMVADATALKARSRELAHQIASHAPLTIQATKEAMRRLRDRSANQNDLDLIELCYGSEDFKEGIDSFLSKRSPVWKGR